MNIRNVIIHRILKKIAEPSILQFRDAVLELDDPVNELFEHVREIYGEKSRKTYGVFDENSASYPFQTMLNQYHIQDKSFFDFSCDALKHLKSLIDRQNLATGGYLFFAHYTEPPSDFLLILMLNDRQGVQIDEQTLSVKDVQHLDLEKLHLAARVNLSKWISGDHPYISFVKGGRSRSYSQYFLDFVGCTDYTPPRVSTKKLIDAIGDFCRKNDLSREQTRVIKNQVHDYCQSRSKEHLPVDLAQLSHLINGEEPVAFLSYANSDQYQLDSTFDIDPTELRRLQRHVFKGPDWQITFPDELLDDKIIYDQDERTLTIKDVPDDFAHLIGR